MQHCSRKGRPTANCAMHSCADSSDETSTIRSSQSPTACRANRVAAHRELRRVTQITQSNPELTAHTEYPEYPGIQSAQHPGAGHSGHAGHFKSTQSTQSTTELRRVALSP